MYSEAEVLALKAQLRKRRWIIAIPSFLLLAAAVALFVRFQHQRSESGWMISCAMSIVAGVVFFFLYSLHVTPLRLYLRHVQDMLTGLTRETSGILAEVAERPTDRDGLNWYALLVNIGDRNDPKDDRLFYYDALKGRPDMPVGTQVTIISHDKRIAEIQEQKT